MTNENNLMASRLKMAYRGRRSYLKTTSGTVFSHNTDVWRVNAGPNEPGQMVELNISHLKITTQESTIMTENHSNIISPKLHGNRKGREL